MLRVSSGVPRTKRLSGAQCFWDIKHVKADPLGLAQTESFLLSCGWEPGGSELRNEPEVWEQIVGVTGSFKTRDLWWVPAEDRGELSQHVEIWANLGPGVNLNIQEIGWTTSGVVSKRIDSMHLEHTFPYRAPWK